VAAIKLGMTFTRCSGALPRSAGDYERGSDPWISFGPTGTAHYMALVTDNSVNENAMVTARTTDGGSTWSAPVVIARMPAQDPVARSLFHDRKTALMLAPSMTQGSRGIA